LTAASTIATMRRNKDHISRWDKEKLTRRYQGSCEADCSDPIIAAQCAMTTGRVSIMGKSIRLQLIERAIIIVAPARAAWSAA
jgi:hypothetical protein